MMPWVPSTDFENEYVALQPDHDFIYGRLNDSAEEVHYPRPESHVRFILEKKKKDQQAKQINCSSKNSKLKIIEKVQKISGTKALGEQPTLEDWDDDTNVESETIAMMRHLGLQPSIEEPLKEECTVATLPLTEEMLVMHNGTKRMPILYNEKFFKFKPRVAYEFKDTYTNEQTQSAALDDYKTDDNVFNNSNELSTSTNCDTDDVFETPDSSLKEYCDNDTTLDESYNTAFCQSFTSSLSTTNKSLNSSLSTESSKTGSNNAKGRKKWRVVDAGAFFTPKELYFKYRRN